MLALTNSQLWKMLEASLLQWIGVVLLIAILAWAIIRVRAWFREDEDPAETEHQMLSQFGDLHRQGDLSDEEYRSIKSRLVERLDSRTHPQQNGE